FHLAGSAGPGSPTVRSPAGSRAWLCWPITLGRTTSQVAYERRPLAPLSANVNQALLNTLTVAQSELRAVAVVETDLGDLPPVRCFLSELNQVFLNLVVNAAHAVADARRDQGGII